MSLSILFFTRKSLKIITWFVTEREFILTLYLYEGGLISNVSDCAIYDWER